MDDTIKQQDAEQATPVNSFAESLLSDIHETIDEKTLLVEKEEKVLAEGIDSDFWQIIKKRLQQRVHSLRGAASLRLGNGGMNFQEIGVKAVIVNEIADGLQDIINLVEHPYKRRMAELADKKAQEAENKEGGEV